MLISGYSLFWTLAAPLFLAVMAKAFQGDLVMHADGTGGSATLLLSISGSEGRLDVRTVLGPLGQTSRFSLVSRAQDSGKVWMFDETQKCRELSPAPKPTSDTLPYQVKAGADTTLLGIACKRYALTRKRERVEAILAPELLELDTLLSRFQESSPLAAGKPLAKALAGKGFPLAYSVERADGNAKVETLHIRRGPLAEGRLALPAGCEPALKPLPPAEPPKHSEK